MLIIKECPVQLPGNLRLIIVTPKALLYCNICCLALNTHINLDLAIASAVTAPGNNIYALQTDFNRINQLIAALTDDVQECLCKVWFPMRMITKITNGRQMAVLNFSIDKARDASWANAVILAAFNQDQQQAYIQQMDVSVKALGSKIFSPWPYDGIYIKSGA